MRKITQQATLVLAITLASCGGTKPVLTTAEIDSAQQAGSLEGLYSQLSTQLSQTTRVKSPDAFAQLDEVGQRIANKKADVIRSQINSLRLESGLIPANKINALQQQAGSIETFHSSTFNTVNSEIQSEQDKTAAEVERLTGKLNSLPENAYTDRMEILQALSPVTGDKMYDYQYEDLLKSLEQRLTAAQQAGEYEQAKNLLSVLPDSEATREAALTIDAKLFEKKFDDALIAGDLDSAFANFETLTQAENFAALKPRLKKVGQDLAGYFDIEADQATANGDLNTAYKGYSQARLVRKSLDLPLTKTDGLQSFLDQVKLGADRANAESLPGLASGYLHIIKSFNPAYPGLRALTRSTDESVLAQAMKRVSTTPFKNASNGQEFGDAISSKITQYLFTSLPNDLRIIEREDYEAIQREQQLNGSSQLSAVDYLISGSVLESKVEVSLNKNNVTKRVQTGTTTAANPDYATWLNLSEQKQRNTPEPPKTLSTPQYEDVSYSVTRSSKVGYFSVSFRLINASTGKVLLPDNITLHETFEAESNEGMELGDFKLEAQNGQLPSDIEILNTLASQVSAEIGKRLAAMLENAELKYSNDAQRFADEGNPIDAAEQYAYALAISRQKDMDTTALLAQLQTQALASGYSEPVAASTTEATAE